MKIKINGMKQKVKILKLNTIIGEGCYFSPHIVSYDNRPKSKKEYKKMCEKHFKNVSHWNASTYQFYEKERLSDGHSSRIYIRIVSPFNNK